LARSIALAGALALVLLPSALGTPFSPSADARVEGTWKVSLVFTVADGLANRKVGDRVAERWRFRPRCAAGACAVELHRGGRTLLLRRTASAYVGTRVFEGAFFCAGTTYPRGTRYVESWRVQVARSKRGARGRTATRIVGVGATVGRSKSGLPCAQVTSRERVEFRGVPTPSSG
jgi:hypothetical protein